MTVPPLLDDAAALAVATALGAKIAPSADERDRDRRLPGPELDLLSASGLLGITVPREFGGAPVSVRTLASVFMALARGDASIAQIPQSHMTFLEALRLQGSEDQQRRFFAEASAGKRFANAQSERGTPSIAIDWTTFEPAPDGTHVANGRKFYSTGALFAQWLVVRGVVGDIADPQSQRRKVLAYIPADTPGVRIDDDWDGLGQRTTSSGTVTLTDVVVPDGAVVPYSAIFDTSTTYGARAQLLHAAIDAGIARAAVDTARDVVVLARPAVDAGVDSADRDPLLIQQFGDIEIAVRSAEALVREAGSAIDDAEHTLTADTAAAASVATAAAKVSSTRAALDATAAVFDAGGTRSAAASSRLDRLWRDARTHTLHDPVRWKTQHVGRYALTGAHPPRHGLV
ncbi:SfnB family sulfur acquisition oxidoreductase [Rhodococcus sp. MEB064]|uniref:SfnB family sulfur acquisition oxidoreductase n=1 Tax=Rhodococcus sp. MEB064 TaxID=1587522 RepID=UPI0005AD067F|nr:SfnB family sulfur acquisition oxidoreductase [Rhodococcus sp. MEB064]KIQ15098.1 monooxygenase [Rhodococcus sp. MEB064]